MGSSAISLKREAASSYAVHCRRSCSPFLFNGPDSIPLPPAVKFGDMAIMRRGCILQTEYAKPFFKRTACSSAPILWCITNSYSGKELITLFIILGYKGLRPGALTAVPQIPRIILIRDVLGRQLALATGNTMAGIFGNKGCIAAAAWTCP